MIIPDLTPACIALRRELDPDYRKRVDEIAQVRERRDAAWHLRDELSAVRHYEVIVRGTA